MATKRCFYEILLVTRQASEEEIKRSYRKLAMQYHPDRNVGDQEAEIKFREAAEAYEVLRDPQKRALYDRGGHAALEGRGGMPHFDNAEDVMDLFGGIFGDIFGNNGRRGGRGRGPQGGRDLQMTVEIDLLEAARGTRRTLQIPREENCVDCNGTGAKKGTEPSTCRRCNGHGAVISGQGFFRIQQTCNACGGRGSVITDPCRSCHGAGRVEKSRQLEVSIPKGVDNDMRVRVPGEGEPGVNGAPPGDFYCLIRVKKHPFFQRNQNDLHCEVPITISQAALGGTIELPTIENRMKSHTLNRGIQTGAQVRIPGEGIPDVHGGTPGDLIVHVKVITPRNLTKRQEELLRELGELDKSHVPPERKSWLERIREFFTTNPTPVD